MTYYPPQSGPCIICGDTNYGLSCGGPTICPKCDCGHFDAATVEKQAKIIAELRAQLASVSMKSDAALAVPQAQDAATPLRDTLIEIAEACEKATHPAAEICLSKPHLESLQQISAKARSALVSRPDQ